MSIVGYIFLSLFVLFISWRLFRRASGDMSIFRPNLISFTFYYALVAQSFVGVNIVIHWLDNHYLISKIRDSDVRQMAYFAVLYVMVTMPFAMWVTCRFLGTRPRSLLKRYVRAPLISALSPKDSFVFYPLVFLTLLCFIAILYTFYTLRQIPLMAVISGASAEELSITRVTTYRGFQGNIYLRNIVAVGFTPILSYIAIGYSLMYKTLKWKTLSFALVSLAFIVVTYDLSKAPLINYLLGIVFLLVLAGKLKRKHVLLIGGGLFLLIIIMYVLLGHVTDPRLLFAWNTGPIGRIILGQVTSLFYHFRIFPDMHPFLHGASLPALFLKMMGSSIEHKTSARLVMEIVNPAGIASGSAGVMNTLFVAEAYANWGWPGLVLAPFWVGLVIQTIYIFFLRSRKTPVLLGLFAFLAYKIPSMVTGGFIGFVYNPGMLAIVLLGLSPYIGGIVSKTMLWKPQHHAS